MLRLEALNEFEEQLVSFTQFHSVSELTAFTTFGDEDGQCGMSGDENSTPPRPEASNDMSLAVLPPFPAFDVHDSNAGPRWGKWLTRFERLLVGLNITDPTRKRALLLHYAGNDVDDIFDTLTDTGDAAAYQQAADKLTEYFSPQKNRTYEVYNFRQTKQQEGESLDSYHTRLRQLAKTCGYENADREIAEHIILTCTSWRIVSEQHMLKRKTGSKRCTAFFDNTVPHHTQQQECHPLKL